MCKFKLFSIAAAALMMVACSTEDLTQQTQIKTGEMHFTATIAAPSGTTRTTYEQDGDNINVKWVVGDEIALVHNKVKDVAKVKTINSDGSATITGYVTGATNEADVQLYYPAARISGVTSDGNPVFDGSVEGKISSQDGTLKYIQDNLDFRVGSSTFSVNGSEATLKEAAKMYSQIDIWKLKLKDNASALLKASKVSIKMGSGVYTTSATATLSSPNSELTIATIIPRAIDNVRPITIEATVDNDTYVYSQDNVDVTPGKYYQSTVTMAKAATDLSKLTGDYTVKNGEELTGTLTANYKISIAAGATVTLADVTITGENNSSYKWAGITCEGDATIILKDGTTNTVKGFYEDYPGILAAVGHTLIIKGGTAGTGSLDASSNGCGAGIGGGYEIACGNIEIQGGTVTAKGGDTAAGIGSGQNAGCGSITISGGTVTATGGSAAAGIGSGSDSNASCVAIIISGGTVTATGGSAAAGIGSGRSGACDKITISGGTVTATGGGEGAGIGSGKNAKCVDITITTGVTKVTATKGSSAPNSIGAGNDGYCGTVTIGCTLDNDGKPVGGKTGTISTSPYTYDPNAPALNLTSPAVGQVIGDDGKNYDYASLPGGVTAVAKICYVSGSNGLALALADEGEMDWSTAGTTCSGKNTSTPITGAKWLLASKDQWNNMITAAGGYTALRDGFSGIAGASNLQSNFYWSSTEDDSNNANAWLYRFSNGQWYHDSKGYGDIRVRACLAF